MSKELVFEFIKQQTLGKKDGEGEQIRLTSEQIKNGLDFNEATVFANLRELNKFPGFQISKYRIRRIKGGRYYVFPMRYYWIE